MARILVVDDETAIKKLFETILSGQGHAVITASNGLEGIANVLGFGNPDLIITDQNMPVKTGVEMLRELKKLRGPFQVLMVSGQANQEDIDHLLQFLGTEMGDRSELILKPIDINRFLAAVGRILA